MRFPLSSLKNAVIGTLAFWRIYDSGLSQERLEKLLLVHKGSEDELDEVLNTLSFSDKEGVVGLDKDFSVNSNSDVLLGKARKYCAPLRFVPFVRMVAVCNTVAFGVADEESDIDLFVVAAKGRLFLVRTLVTLYFQLLGLRRHGKKVKGRFCLSFFVAEDGMDLDEIRQKPCDIYLAFWLMTLMPVVGGSFLQTFYKENKWLKEYFSPKTLSLNATASLEKRGSLVRWLELVLNIGIAQFCEWGLKTWQMRRALKKLQNLGEESSIVISPKMLKFHNVDRRKTVQEEWEKLFKKYAS